MTPKIKNILIFVAIGIVLVLIYIFFFNKGPDVAPLVSTSGTGTVTSTTPTDQDSTIAQNFLALLLSVNSIKLNDSIFSDPTFINLHDSSIVLTPDGTQGRPNPFAPLGTDVVTTPVNTSTTTPTPTTTSSTTVTTKTPPATTVPLPH